MKKSIPLTLVVTGLLCGCESLPEQPTPMVAPPMTAPPVANLDVTLDLTRHYNVTCHEGQTPKVYSDCRIIGFAGPVMSAQQGLVSTDGYFDHWLVIETSYGQRVFLPPGVIASIEETKK